MTGDTSYADKESMIESLKTMSAICNIPLSRYLRDLLEGSVDSISFTKDKPYYYFFSRRFEKSISITIKETERIMEFSIPLDDVEKIITI